MGNMWLICWVSVGRCVLRNGKVHFSMRQFLPDTDAVARMSPFSDYPGPMHLYATSSYGPCSYTHLGQDICMTPPLQSHSLSILMLQRFPFVHDMPVSCITCTTNERRAAAKINIQVYNHIKCAAGHISLHTELQCTCSAKETMRELTLRRQMLHGILPQRDRVQH